MKNIGYTVIAVIEAATFVTMIIVGLVNAG